MNAGRTARERARLELAAEIVSVARRQLATEGAGGLSLRAVARELGMASSAVHRYFRRRDDLLTALIIDGYNALGEAVETADRTVHPGAHHQRWTTVCHAVRNWALEHPHEYALLYGSPVPGYQAPQDTIGPAMRDTVVYGRILADAHEAGVLAPPRGLPPAPARAAVDAEAVRAVMPGLPDALILRAVSVWTALFGWISFELFGQFDSVIEQRELVFDHHIRCLAVDLGLPDR